MLEGYKILAITHRNTELHDIGQFIVKHADESELRTKLINIKATFGITELIYLATCNRVLFFFYSEDSFSPSFPKDFFNELQPEIPDHLIDKHVMFLEGVSAIDHVFKVAASVDSLVVGEREILRQFREAYASCLEWNLTGDHLRIAMEATVASAKQVYSLTRLGEKSVSVVSLAIKELLKTKLSRKARVLMIGAGQTNSLVAKFLKKYGYNNVTVFNRTIEKAQGIANMLGGEAMSFKELENHRSGFDCMIVCTGATQAVVDEVLYHNLLCGETDKKLIIDLAIPNNIDAAVTAKFNTQYIQIEGLKLLAQENLEFREQEVSNACALLQEHLEAFEVKARHRHIERALQTIPQEVKAVKERALNEVFKKEIETLDSDARLLLERMMGYMEKKCTGIPIKVAKQAFVSVS